MNDMAKNIILWVIIAIVLMSVFNNFSPRQVRAPQVEYSQFIADVKEGRVAKVLIEDRTIRGVRQDGERFSTYSPGDPGLIGDLLAHNVAIEARAPEETRLLMQM